MSLQNGDPKQDSRSGGKESKSISNELASTINDGLYFYEQVKTLFFCFLLIIYHVHHFLLIKFSCPIYYQQELKQRRSNRRKSNCDNRDRNLKSPSHTLGTSNIKAGENTTGGSNVQEDCGSNNSRRKQRVFHKQQSSLQQRFFSSNFRNHGTGRNSHGVISESPPSNSVGFFFASTPPENHR